MKPIKFDTKTINQIREYAKTHTKMECCNRFTLTPRVFIRVAKEHSIQFVPETSRPSHVQNPTKRKIPDGMITDGKGFVMCLKPEWYTGRKSAKYVYYHSVVMCEALGITEIPKGFLVRHIDSDKRNNDISNLILLSLSANDRLNQT